MTSRTLQGEFWLAGDENNRQRGVLDIAPLAAPVVKTFGPLLSPWQEKSRKQVEGGRTQVTWSIARDSLMVPVTIHGQDSAGTPLTVLDALASHWGQPDQTGARHVLQGSQAIIGAHIPDRDHHFTGIRVRLSKLRAYQPLLQEPTWVSEGVLGNGATVAFQTPEASGGTSDHQSPWISAQGFPPATMRVLDRSIWQPLISLFTLATGSPCTSLERQVQESPGASWQDAYSEALHPDAKDTDTYWEPPRWLLQPTDLQMQHIVAWLDKAELLGPLPAVVADVAHSRPITIDTQVLLLTTVAEGLHRRLYPEDVRFDDNIAKQVRTTAATAVSSIHEQAEDTVRGLLSHVEDVGYGSRLACLARTVDAIMPGVTGKTNRWKNLVSDARNEYAHRLKSAFLNDEDFDRYLTVAFSLRWLLTGVLLLQADLSAKKLTASFEGHEPYQRFLADAIKWQPRIYESG